MRLLALALLAAALSPPAPAAEPAEDYRIYTDHPRLFLRPQRLRLLRRERDRQSMRWTEFEALVHGGAQFPEPGFAQALYFETAADNAAGRRAVEWALGPDADVRQIALVFDWCRSLLADAEKARFVDRLEKALDSGPPHDLASARDRVLAAIAIAEERQDASERQLQAAIQQWWRSDTAPRLNSGALRFSQADLLPLFEMINAVRDNLNLDLREDAPEYFQALPAWYVSSFYPATWPGSENEYRIPSYAGQAPPDLDASSRARIGGLEMVACDTNARENQYVQGWLVLDRYMLRSPYGAPYEFLWANPYQPGLAYAGLPLLFYDKSSGALFVRSGWGDDAAWFGIVGSEFQLFQDGAVKVLDTGKIAGAAQPLEIGPAAIVAGSRTISASVDPTFVIGLKPLTEWNVRAGNRVIRIATTDRAGTLALHDLKPHSSALTLSEHVAPAVPH
jgi:hypothetical protein